MITIEKDEFGQQSRLLTLLEQETAMPGIMLIDNETPGNFYFFEWGDNDSEDEGVQLKWAAFQGSLEPSALVDLIRVTTEADKTLFIKFLQTILPTQLITNP